MGNTNRVSSVEERIPPITTVARGRCTSAPVPVAMAMGIKPSEATSAVMSTGLSVTSVTVGIDISDKNYGTGISRSVFVKAEVPAGQDGIPVEDLTEKLIHLMHDAHVAVQSSRYSQGDIGPQELEQILDRAEKRTRNAIKVLRESLDE